VAREIVDFLAAAGLKCWISVRDVHAGQNYQEAIVHAIEGASGIVFLFSDNANKSAEIRKELSIGASMMLPLFPVRLAPIAPSGALRYELAIRQWIDIFPNRQYALSKLVETVKKALAVPEQGPIAAPSAAPPARNAAAARPPAARPSRAKAPAQPRDPIVAPGTAQFEAIRTLLARHIGPIAKVFVEKAATQARTPDEFCEQLATHVAAPSDRTTFVKAVRASLAPKS